MVYFFTSFLKSSFASFAPADAFRVSVSNAFCYWQHETNLVGFVLGGSRQLRRLLGHLLGDNFAGLDALGECLPGFNIDLAVSNQQAVHIQCTATTDILSFLLDFLRKGLISSGRGVESACSGCAQPGCGGCGT